MKNSAIILALFFSVSGTSIYGHSEENNINLEILDLSEISITILDLVQPTCNGLSNGSISVEVSGGKAPYTFNWNTFPNQYESIATDLKEGLYFVYVSDAEGKSAFKSIEIQDPSRSILTNKDLKSLDHLDLTATVKSENSQIVYRLNELIINSFKVSELPVGVHKLKITDSDNCVLTQFIQVFELKSSGEDEIEASAEFINEGGAKIIVSELIPEKRVTDFSREVVVKKKD